MAEKDKQQQDVRAGKGRRDEVGRSGVYPMSGPHPKGPAEIRIEPGWGQGERGATGYEDHGRSEMTYTDGQVLGAVTEDETLEVPEGEIPRAEWVRYFDRFSKRFRGIPLRIEVGREHRVAQEGVPFDGIGADEKDRENDITVTAGSDSVRPVTHIISRPRRVSMHREGEMRVLEIDSRDGPVTLRLGPNVKKAA